MIELVRKKGRPCKGRGPQNKKCTLKFTQEEYNKFDIVAKNRGITRTSFVKEAVEYAWKQDLGL